MNKLPFDVSNVFNHSFTAWQSWNLLDAKHRCEMISAFISDLPSALKNAGHYQLAHSRKVVESIHQLAGPTGETNELYTSGRGVAVLAVDSDEKNTHIAAIALSASMLAAGNSVIVCCDDETLTQVITNHKDKKTSFERLIQCAPFSHYKDLLEKDIRSFAFIGNAQVALEINKLLALRSGAITALVSETDLTELPQSQDPKLVLRFLTERTRTINITAVGGNATLLELGNDSK